MIRATMYIGFMRNRNIDETLAANHAIGLGGRPVHFGGLLPANVPLGRGVGDD